MGLSQSLEGFCCPYPGCGHLFEKPNVVVYSVGLLSSAYYGCPSCKATIKIIMNNNRIRKVEASRDNLPTKPHRVLSAPENGAPHPTPQCLTHHQMVLATSRSEVPPDDCFTCSHLLSCKNTLFKMSKTPLVNC